jgi:hypothetical protein
MECVVEQILPLGESGGAGNLIVCRIVLMHIAEEVLNDKGRIDPHKIDLMGRLGRFYYVRASGAAIEEIVQEATTMGVGFDGLPAAVRFSPVLTGNHLGMLAGLPALPSPEEAATVLLNDERARQAAGNTDLLQEYAREALDRGDIPLGAALAVLSGG